MELPYGDRHAMVKDAWNKLWQIATRGVEFAINGKGH